MRNVIMAALIFTAVACSTNSVGDQTDSTNAVADTTVRVDTASVPDSQPVAVPAPTDSVTKF